MQKKLPEVVTLFVISFVSVVFVPFVRACSPGGPDPWFKTKLQFDLNNLPAGVEIVQSEDKYLPYAILNKNPEPLYIVKEDNTDWQRFPLSELPENYEPVYKLYDNKAYYYINDEFTKPPEVGYKQNSGGINNSAASKVGIDERVIYLDGESKNIYRDDRPAQVDIPTPQQFHILAYYQSQPLYITGNMQYTLNETYDPKALEKGIKTCSEWNTSPKSPINVVFSFFVIISPLVFLGLIGLLIYKIIKHFIKR